MCLLYETASERTNAKGFGIMPFHHQPGGDDSRKREEVRVETQWRAIPKDNEQRQDRTRGLHAAN